MSLKSLYQNLFFPISSNALYCLYVYLCRRFPPTQCSKKSHESNIFYSSAKKKQRPSRFSKFIHVYVKYFVNTHPLSIFDLRRSKFTKIDVSVIIIRGKWQPSISDIHAGSFSYSLLDVLSALQRGGRRFVVGCFFARRGTDTARRFLNQQHGRRVQGNDAGM